MLMEVSPAARHPPTAGRGGQAQRGAAPCVGGWVEGVPGALRWLHLILKELPGSQPGSQPGSATPEQRKAGRAARKDFDVLRMSPSHRAVLTAPGDAELLDLLLSGNAHRACPSSCPHRWLSSSSGSMAPAPPGTSAGSAGQAWGSSSPNTAVGGGGSMELLPARCSPSAWPGGSHLVWKWAGI